MKHEKFDINISHLGLTDLLMFTCLKKQKTVSHVGLFIPVCYYSQALYECKINYKNMKQYLLGRINLKNIGKSQIKKNRKEYE